MKGDRNIFRAIRWPVTLITLGVLFAVQNFTSYDFGQTWPVLLIVFGVLSLLGRTVAPEPPAAPPPQYGWQPQPWQSQPWQQPADATAPGGYRATSYAQGPYPQPPAGADPGASPAPAKGGFGASAPPKPDSPTEDSTNGGAV